MNHKRHTYYFLLLLPLLFFSCSQEELPAVAGGDEAGIIFRAPLPSVSSRAASTDAASLDDGFHVSAISPLADLSGDTLNMYFEHVLVTKTDAGTFGAEECKWPATRDGSEGRLRFFAYYPSCDAMRESAAAGDDYFVMKNHTRKTGGSISYDYRMERFKINKDIAGHFDFVTAMTEGSKADDLFSGVMLDFEHQLSSVSLQAWGNSNTYTAEIAGMRLGCAAVEGDFNFAGAPANISEADRTRSGSWLNSSKGNVDYIFRAGDKVVSIGKGSHDSAGQAASIMGSGDRAMVIPDAYTAWDHKNDPVNEAQGLYFSVLLRIIDKTGAKLYPYAEELAGDLEVIYLAIDKATAEVIAQLYKDGDTYFSDPLHTEAYTVPAAAEVRDYAWAAVPVSAIWKPGYDYTYTLDYSKGVGVHAPDSPKPGTPILFPVMVGVNEAITIIGWDPVDFDAEL